jgi:hypothetical protein
MRLIMEITLSADGRYEGEILREDAIFSFSGTLELLKVLEDLLCDAAPSGADGPRAEG